MKLTNEEGRKRKLAGFGESDVKDNDDGFGGVGKSKNDKSKTIKFNSKWSDDSFGEDEGDFKFEDTVRKANIV